MYMDTSYLKGRYLEKDLPTRRGQSYKLMADYVLFYKESVVYPYVNYESKGKKLVISNIDYVDVISYAEKSGMSAI